MVLGQWSRLLWNNKHGWSLWKLIAVLIGILASILSYVAWRIFQQGYETKLEPFKNPRPSSPNVAISICGQGATVRGRHAFLKGALDCQCNLQVISKQKLQSNNSVPLVYNILRFAAGSSYHVQNDTKGASTLLNIEEHLPLGRSLRKVRQNSHMCISGACFALLKLYIVIVAGTTTVPADPQVTEIPKCRKVAANEPQTYAHLIRWHLIWFYPPFWHTQWQ